MSFRLTCCPGCNTWRKYDENEEYFKCDCGCETFTDEWIKEHPEHSAYQQYLDYMAKEEENG